MAYKRKFKLTITDEVYEKMQSRNQLWTREAFDQSEELAGQFKDNIIYMCEKKGVKINEMGLKFQIRRLYKWGEVHAIYPTLIEITFFSKYFEIDPGRMVSKDLRAVDRLKSISKKDI